MFELIHLDSDKNQQGLAETLLAQLRNQETWTVHTSGSTGVPKTITLPYSTIKASAEATNAYFKLNENTLALLSLNLNTIGGKMMIARAYFGNYKLVIGQAKQNPFANLTSRIDFTTVVPTQIQAILQENMHDKCSTYLLGGAPISNQLEEQLRQEPQAYYHSYGMSETASHVALRKIGDSPAVFEAIQGVSFSTNEDQLVIHAPSLVKGKLKTTDLVNLIDEKHFVWLGRADFAINSGGYKIIPEILEKQWATYLKQAFFFAGEKDDKWGEKLVLYIEGKACSDIPWKQMKSDSKAHEWPKEIYLVREFTYSESGKILREASQQKSKQKIEAVL